MFVGPTSSYQVRAHVLFPLLTFACTSNKTKPPTPSRSSQNQAFKLWKTPNQACNGLVDLMHLEAEGNVEHRQELQAILKTWAGPLTTWRCNCSGGKWLVALNKVMEGFQAECRRLRNSTQEQDTFNRAILGLLVRSICFAAWLHEVRRLFQLY